MSDTAHERKYFSMGGGWIFQNKNEYGGVTVWDNGNKPSGGVNSDRLRQWDNDKYDFLSKKHFGDSGQNWDNRSPAKIESFLQDYNANPGIRLCNIIRYTHTLGYPYWYLGYDYDKKPRPILFSPSMTWANLQYWKTETRRIVPHKFSHLSDEEVILKSPYGWHGSWLYGRETWRAKGWNGGRGIIEYRADNAELVVRAKRAGLNITKKNVYERGVKSDKWRPSIHQNQAFSRTRFRVNSLEIQRVQEITDEQCLAEGIREITKDGGRTYKYGICDKDGLPGTDDFGWAWREFEKTPREAFAKLWDKINAKRGYPWQSNPRVYRVSYELKETEAVAGFYSD